MEGIRLLNEFFTRAKDDVLIAPVHISLYCVLLYLWMEKNCENPVAVCRNKLMELAKISARGTFYKTIKQLHESGFVKYLPKPNQFCQCLVYIMDPEKKMHEYRI
jgi:hypothetical protein